VIHYKSNNTVNSGNTIHSNNTAGPSGTFTANTAHKELCLAGERVFSVHVPPARLDGEIFIVHGHNKLLLEELKSYLVDRLGLPKPVVLQERIVTGPTIIEQLEAYAEQTALVFVMLTKDDPEQSPVCARPNVIFELGYFMAKLGRKSGKVIILCEDGVEIPSDIKGVRWIKIKESIRAAGEDIRDAVSYALGWS